MSYIYPVRIPHQNGCTITVDNPRQNYLIKKIPVLMSDFHRLRNHPSLVHLDEPIPLPKNYTDIPECLIPTLSHSYNDAICILSTQYNNIDVDVWAIVSKHNTLYAMVTSDDILCYVVSDNQDIFNSKALEQSLMATIGGIPAFMDDVIVATGLSNGVVYSNNGLKIQYNDSKDDYWFNLIWDKCSDVYHTRPKCGCSLRNRLTSYAIFKQLLNDYVLTFKCQDIIEQKDNITRIAAVVKVDVSPNDVGEIQKKYYISVGGENILSLTNVPVEDEDTGASQLRLRSDGSLRLTLRGKHFNDTLSVVLSSFISEPILDERVKNILFKQYSDLLCWNGGKDNSNILPEHYKVVKSPTTDKIAVDYTSPDDAGVSDIAEKIIQHMKEETSCSNQTNQ